MARLDLQGFLDDDSVQVPVPTTKYPDGDHYYTIPSPSSADGLLLSAMANIGVRAAAGGEVGEADIAALKLDEQGELDLYRMVLGATYDELQADGISWTRLKRLGEYMFVHWAMSDDAAAAMAAGEGQAPNRATRRAVKKATAKSPSRGSRATSTPRKRKTA